MSLLFTFQEASWPPTDRGTRVAIHRVSKPCGVIRLAGRHQAGVHHGTAIQSSSGRGAWLMPGPAGSIADLRPRAGATWVRLDSARPA